MHKKFPSISKGRNEPFARPHTLRALFHIRLNPFFVSKQQQDHRKSIAPERGEKNYVHCEINYPFVMAGQGYWMVTWDIT